MRVQYFSLTLQLTIQSIYNGSHGNDLSNRVGGLKKNQLCNLKCEITGNQGVEFVSGIVERR